MAVPVQYKPEEVIQLVIKLAKEGHTPSKIGLILRDQYGIPDVRAITGKSILQILEEHGLAPEIPEDLLYLIKKYWRVKKHMEQHRKDMCNKRNLQRIYHQIQCLVKYYKRIGKLPPHWEFTEEIAKIYGST